MEIRGHPLVRACEQRLFHHLVVGTAQKADRPTMQEMGCCHLPILTRSQLQKRRGFRTPSHRQGSPQDLGGEDHQSPKRQTSDSVIFLLDFLKIINLLFETRSGLLHGN